MTFNDDDQLSDVLDAKQALNDLSGKAELFAILNQYAFALKQNSQGQLMLVTSDRLLQSISQNGRTTSVFPQAAQRCRATRGDVM